MMNRAGLVRPVVLLSGAARKIATVIGTNSTHPPLHMDSMVEMSGVVILKHADLPGSGPAMDRGSDPAAALAATTSCAMIRGARWNESLPRSQTNNGKPG